MSGQSKSVSNSSAIVLRLKQFLNQDDNHIALHEPAFTDKDYNRVKQCIASNWVSSGSNYVDEFEKAIKQYTGSRHCVAVVNGTAALHTALLLSGVNSNDEILVPSLTFAATVNAIHYIGAIPHFIDVDSISLGIDCKKLDDYLRSHSVMKRGRCYNKHTGKRISYIVAVHCLGHPANLDAIAAICKHYRFGLIEDAAESLGSLHKKKHTGCSGHFGILSFNGNKIVTCGGGGAILTQDTRLAEKARHVTTTAKISHPWEICHDRLGYNYRLPGLNAALGLSQLENIEDSVAHKRALARAYQMLFKNVPEVSIFKEAKYARSNYWLNLLTVKNKTLKNQLLKELHLQNIHARPLWRLMHTLEYNKHCPKMDLSGAEFLYHHAICLPSSPQLYSQSKHAAA